MVQLNHLRLYLGFLTISCLLASKLSYQFGRVKRAVQESASEDKERRKEEIVASSPFSPQPSAFVSPLACLCAYTFHGELARRLFPAGYFTTDGKDGSSLFHRFHLVKTPGND